MGMHSGGWFSYITHDDQKEKPVITRDLLEKVWQFAKPYWIQVIALLITILVISGISLISPLLYRDLIDVAIPEKDLSRINLLALGMIGIPILNGIIGVWQRRLNAVVGEGVIFDLRQALYEHLQRMSLRFFTETRTGELMSRLNNDVIGAQRAISNTLVTIALLVKLFGREKSEGKRFRTHAREVRDIGIRSAVVGHWFFMLLSVVSAVGSAIVFWVGSHLVLRGEFTIGTIVAFGTYLAGMYGPLMALTNAQVQFAESLVSFERVFEVLDIPLEITQKKEALELKDIKGKIEFLDVNFSYRSGDEEKIGLKDVARISWRSDGMAHLKRGITKGHDEIDQQPGVTRWALHNISFSILPGELVALVGPSGAGKTTATYLIPRLYDPTAGKVLLDGHDIKNLRLSTLADNIGMVTQETFLFFDTIRANLLYANPEASDQEMVAAAKVANIHELIMTLSDRYDTVVGERGYRLSGGERQRIAIARVVLRDPRILILDEATSSLDSLSEDLIQQAMKTVMENRTSLVIAHRLSTILAADKILVFDKGILIQHGTHDQLLNTGGLYRTLYETQFNV
jgi:ATP-binding cassette subfamily B protein